MFRITMLGKKTGAAAPDKNDQHNAIEAPAPAAPGEPGKTMPEQLAQNLKTQGDAMIQYGARLLVMRELLCSLTTGLPPAARASAEQRFCQRINQLMSLTDDHVLPAEFHRALLAEVNYYLGELKKP